MPFENASNVPGIDWIGESFPEVLASRLGSASLFAVSRDDRIYAFDRLGIPAAAKPSRATIYEMAQQIDADYAIVGRYTFDGSTFTAHAQVMDLGRLRLSPDLTESGPLTSLISIQTALAWDAFQALGLSSNNSISSNNSKEEFLARFPLIRLDALENYIRGILAGSGQEKIRRFKEALRLEPNHALAMLQLARTYYNAHEYEPAISWFARVPQGDPNANEAQFYLGLAAYYGGQMEKAETAFRWLAGRLPLTEIYNNLGVVAARRGEKQARGYFEKSTQTDPSDPDYHFNLAVELYRDGDAADAARQLHECIAIRPDAQAKSFLDAMNSGGEIKDPLLLERIKLNYDESSFRQLAMEIENANETRFQKTDPLTHAALHVQRGQELLEQGLSGEAEKQFREAAVLDPTNAEAHAGLAQAMESQDAGEARSEALAALALKPSAKAYLVLARLNWAGRNAASAEQYLGKALALEPANAAAVSLKQEITAALPDKSRSQP